MQSNQAAKIALSTALDVVWLGWITSAPSNGAVLIYAPVCRTNDTSGRSIILKQGVAPVNLCLLESASFVPILKCVIREQVATAVFQTIKSKSATLQIPAAGIGFVMSLAPVILQGAL